MPVSIADLPFLARLWQDAIVTRWLGGVRSDQQVETTLAHDLSHWAEHGFGRWVLRADAAEVGQVKLAHWQGPNGDDEVEIGYAMVPSAWGRGLATEATRGALALAAESRLAESIVAFALVGNEHSFAGGPGLRSWSTRPRGWRGSASCYRRCSTHGRPRRRIALLA